MQADDLPVVAVVGTVVTVLTVLTIGVVAVVDDSVVNVIGVLILSTTPDTQTSNTIEKDAPVTPNETSSYKQTNKFFDIIKCIKMIYQKH